MKYCLLAVCAIGIMTAGANAAQVSWDFDGTAALTPENLYGQDETPGWERHEANETLADGRSADYTWGTGGALKLLDNDAGGFKSSHLNYFFGERSDGSTAHLGKQGGVAVARVRNNGVSQPAGIGFGYSTNDGNHTGILGIQNGAVSITGWQGGNVFEYDTNGALAGKATSVGANSGYRTYALAWTVDLTYSGGPNNGHTQYDVWVSDANGTALNNPANWTQVITDLHPRLDGTGNGAMPGGPNDGGVESGVMLGSYGPGWGGYGRTAAGDLDFDWLTLQTNGAGYGVTIAPWSVDYAGVPEPTSLLFFVGLAGYLIRRRRA